MTNSLIRTAALTLTAAASLAMISAASADEFLVGTQGNAWFYNGQTNRNIVLRIRAGDTVSWEWAGFHNVVSGMPAQGSAGDGLFRSGNPISPGSYSRVFDTPGTFNYYCQVHGHSGMASSVTVLCGADWDLSGGVNSQDFFAYITSFFADTGDFNNDGATTSQDFFDFITAFLGGC